MEHVSSKRDRSDDFEEEKASRQRIFEEIFAEDLADEAEQENDEAVNLPQKESKANVSEPVSVVRPRLSNRLRQLREDNDIVASVALKVLQQEQMRKRKKRKLKAARLKKPKAKPRKKK